MIEYQADPCDDVISDPNPDTEMVLRLCNFATGKPDLLPAHEDALNEEILQPHWRAKDGKISIIGYASKLGYANKPDGNWNLSCDRCAAVRDFLAPHLPDGFNFKLLDGEGASKSQNDPKINSGFYRAVDVKLHAQGYTKAYPKQPHPIPRHVLRAPSNLFVFVPVKLSSFGIGAAEIGVQRDTLLFKLIDTSTGDSRYFEYTTRLAGISGGKSPIPLLTRSSGWDSSDRPLISTSVAIRDFADFTTIFDPTNASLAQLSRGSVSTAAGSIGRSTVVLQFRPRATFLRGMFDWTTVTFSFGKGSGISVGGASQSNGSITMLPANFVPPPSELP